MGRTEQIKHKYGLIGRNIEYSFSRSYFNKKFKELELDSHSYVNFDLESIADFPSVIAEEIDLKGLNVTIPYKEAIIPYLDDIDPEASKIGAVNTIQFTAKGLKGHNTDVYGFRESLEPHLNPGDKSALILGTGGASKAIAYALEELQISFNYVSRNPVQSQLGYSDLTPELVSANRLIINCTPLGTYPRVDLKPDIPYGAIGKEHLLFDLVYNPDITAFMHEGMSKGARTLNGRKMLELQAEKAWSIWNS